MFFFAYLSSAQFSSAHAVAHAVALALFLIQTAAHIANDFGSHTRSRVFCSHVHHRCVAYTQRGLLLLLVLHKLKTLCATSFVLKCCAVVANVMLPVIVVASECERVYVLSVYVRVFACVCVLCILSFRAQSS